jgi:hypothetical protein
VKGTAGRDCLFEEDQRFQALKGQVSEVIGQVPPGKYNAGVLPKLKWV